MKNLLILPSIGLVLSISNTSLADTFRIHDGKDNAKELFHQLTDITSSTLAIKMTDASAETLAKLILKNKGSQIDNHSLFEQLIETETFKFDSLTCTRVRKLVVGQNSSAIPELQERNAQDVLAIVSGNWNTSNEAYIANFYSCSIHVNN